MGQAPSGDTYNDEGDGLPLIAGAGDFGELYPRPKKFTSAANMRTSLPGDVIVGIRASIGDKVLADDVYCLGRGVAGLRAGPRLNQRYLWNWVTHAAPSLAAKGRGATFLQVNKNDIAEMEIPLPSMDEQVRIAAILDTADALRANRRQALAQLDTLTQAIFIELFGNPQRNPRGWPVVAIGDVLKSATYGTSRKSGASGEFAVLRMGNLTSDGRIDVTDLKYTDLVGREREQHLVTAGDVLFNRTNSAELVGKTAVYRSPEPMAYAGYLVRLRPGPHVEAEYLGAFMNLPGTKRVLRSMCKSIIGMANINAKEVQTIRMPLPPIEHQRRFASHLRPHAELRTRMQQQLRDLDTLFASLQQRAFRGEL